MTGASNKKKRKAERGITGEAATDSAFMKLSFILREIAESDVNKDIKANDKYKMPSDRSKSKFVKSGIKEVNGNDNSKYIISMQHRLI